MFKSFIFSFFILIMTLMSCHQDPYPKEGTLRTVQRSEPQEPLPELSMSIDDVIEFKEGRYREYKVRVAVRGGGRPLVRIDGLPEGAEFNPESLILKWRPNFFNGNDPSDPSISVQTYPVTVWLRSSEDPVRALRRNVNLLVHDIPRLITIETSRNTTVDEGKKFSNTFTIKNTDYPDGPFRVVTSGMPANMELVKVDAKTYRLEFSPDYFHVNRKKDGSSLKYQGKIIVANPANHIQEKELDITVYDKRLESKLVAPKKLTQGLDVSLQVVAYDLNKEVLPELELLSSRPPYGKFKVVKIKNVENFSTILNISWSDIPPSQNGKTHLLSFRSCVLDRRGEMVNCQSQSTEIKLVVRDRKPPVIGRSHWPVGEMVYLGFREKFSRQVQVIDQEDRSLKPRVEVFPVELRKYVKWERGQLSLNFDKAGVFQFNLIATSDYNVSSAESFLVEVFPENRKKTLLFADSTRDPEALFYKGTFKNMDIMNPAIQDINLRNVSDRETLVITTSTLMDKSVESKLLKAINKIKNVVIASPLIDNLPKEFLRRLVEDYDFHAIGRYSELPNMPPLADTKMAKTSHFVDSINPVGLKGIASSVSSNPMIFNGGLDDTRKVCKGVLGLTTTGNNPYVLGVVCRRRNGGRISILGTEWADLNVTKIDSQIPVEWFNTMLKAKF